ncbi:MAG: mechanosensitive ion channel family protein [Coriobacteriia bacterium]|nr:mechanosensitive ion channel family protein [Coriobacteriia bacterium]
MTLFGADIKDYGIMAALVVGGLVIGWLLEQFVTGRLRAAAKRRTWRGWDVIASGLGHMPVWWLGLAGGAVALDVLNWSGQVESYLDKTIIVLAGLTVTVVAMHIATGFVRMYAEATKGAAASSTIFVNLTRIAVVMLGGMLILNALSISITPILTVLGVGGLAVALALQDTLGNLFAGIQIIAGKQIRRGDYIELVGGQAGYVEDIAWRYTTIRKLSNNLVVIPNSTLANSIITNYQLPAEELSVLMEVSVAYGTDLELAESIAKEVAAETVAELSPNIVGYEPTARFHTFGDSAIEMTIVLRASQFTDQWELRHQFIKRLKKRFDEAGIEIPFPQRVVHTRD